MEKSIWASRLAHGTKNTRQGWQIKINCSKQANNVIDYKMGQLFLDNLLRVNEVPLIDWLDFYANIANLQPRQSKMKNENSNISLWAGLAGTEFIFFTMSNTGSLQLGHPKASLFQAEQSQFSLERVINTVSWEKELLLGRGLQNLLARIRCWRRQHQIKNMILRFFCRLCYFFSKLCQDKSSAETLPCSDTGGIVNSLKILLHLVQNT